MTEKFQLSLLCYLVQSPRGENYVEVIDEDKFDITEFKLSIQVLRRYYKIHKRLPGELEAYKFLDQELERTPDLPEKVAQQLRETFEDIYYPLDKRDMDFVEDTLVENLQEKHIDQQLESYAKGDVTAKEFLVSLESVSSLSVPGNEDIFKDSGFLVKDKDKEFNDVIDGAPTFLNDLNHLTAAKGFYSPQLIVFMSGPKYFKTGLVINIGLKYAKYGYKVYYADGENGARSIRNRMKQAVMNCTFSELLDEDVKADLNWNLDAMQKFWGGDLFIDSFPSRAASIKDVEQRLSYLKEKEGFVPDIIIWDSLDHFVPSNQTERKRDPRFQSQAVYYEAIALNKRLGTFAITPAQVNRSAVNKKIFDMKDIAEDFGRVMISHAIFAICATPEELDDGVRRIIPVVQREGVRYKGRNLCYIKVDEERMLVEEAGLEEELDVDDD